MDDLVRLGFGLVLMLLTLQIALRFLVVPITFLRKAGVLRVARWAIRMSWRGLVGLFRVLKSRPRRWVRRPLAGALIRLFK